MIWVLLAWPVIGVLSGVGVVCLLVADGHVRPLAWRRTKYAPLAVTSPKPLPPPAEAAELSGSETVAAPDAASRI